MERKIDNLKEIEKYDGWYGVFNSDLNLLTIPKECAAACFVTEGAAKAYIKKYDPVHVKKRGWKILKVKVSIKS